MDVKIITELKEKHLTQLMELYRQCWWAQDRNLADVKVMLRHSRPFGLLDPEDNLIGFTRVLTDGVYKALLLDVVVDREHRGSGLGNVLMGAVMSDPEMKEIKHLELYCTEEMLPFYEQWGFTADLGNLHLMRRTPSPGV
ncbi:hypothetical protein PSTEL_13720 [Paenibacillus stellifer]|uniref:N-acetyltransferase domain-containing protein n=1 Tax=Paenibacillus stellifer TaxID=169760 RepID=A0A089N5I0_9BACL|nr:GNAT family N-acetyltransferase [Paenibacillus stellifer]AIQ63989.1 hypothetical protein PSTEL_13720 [Paenibacillus stellifer]